MMMVLARARVCVCVCVCVSTIFINMYMMYIMMYCSHAVFDDYTALTHGRMFDGDLESVATWFGVAAVMLCLITGDVTSN